MVSKAFKDYFLKGTALAVITLSFFVVSSVQAKTTLRPTVSSLPAVKKSTTSICHAKGTQYYDQTKNFKSYLTLKDCLKSGGRMPKR